MRRATLACGLLLALAQLTSAQSTRQDPSALHERLLAAPAAATIGGLELRLEAERWIDLMPPLPKSGAPLHALVNVSALEAPLPRGARIGGIWLLLATGEILQAEEIELREPSSPNRLEGVATFRLRAAGLASARVSVEIDAPSFRAYLTSEPLEVGRAY